MEILLIVLAVAVIILLVRSRSGGNKAAESALFALREFEGLLINSWRKLEAGIRETDDPDQTCKLIVGMRRDQLPPDLVQLWAYIDDLTERANRRAEHYETLANAPAPPSIARSEGDRVMGWIRARAAATKAPADQKGKPRRKSAKGDGAATTTPATQRKPPEEQIAEALRAAKNIVAEKMGGDLDKEVPLKDLDQIGAKMEKTPGQELAGTALRLMLLEMAVKMGSVDGDQVLRIITDAEVTFRDIQEQGGPGDPANLDPLILLHKSSRQRLDSIVRARKQ